MAQKKCTVVKYPCCGKTFKSKTAMTMHQNENEFKKTQNFKIHGAMKGMGKYSQNVTLPQKIFS